MHLSISERRACLALGQHRSTQRKIPRGREDEEQLTDDLVALVREHGRLGYRKMAALLRSTSGWVVNDKRVERIWRQEGLKVPRRQPKRSRIWPSDGACTQLRAERPNHVWSYDFVEDRTHDGRKGNAPVFGRGFGVELTRRVARPFAVSVSEPV